MAVSQPAKADAGERVKAIRFETLDSWRGICALLVAVMHFPATGFISESPFIRSAYLFVDYFFVLSGFVIAHGYASRLGSRVEYGRFAVLRFGRIYPLHVAVLVAFFVFEMMRLAVPALRGDGAAPFTDGNSPGELLSSLLLLNGMGVDSRLTWNGPSWSISAEMWTYMVFGLVVLLFGRRHWMALVVPILAGPAVLYAWSPHNMDATWDFGFVRCLYGFSLGALIYHFAGPVLTRVRQTTGPMLPWTIMELVAIVIVAAFVSSVGKGPYSLGAPFIFAVALLIFAREAGSISRLLRSRAFLWLGALSYGIYMVHVFVQARMINAASLVEKMTGIEIVGDFTMAGETFYGFGLMGGAFGTAMLFVMVIAVIAAAYVGYVLVEMPFQRLSRKIAGRIGQSTRRDQPTRLLTAERAGSP